MPQIINNYSTIFSSGGHGRQPRSQTSSGFSPIATAPSGPIPGNFSVGTNFTPGLPTPAEWPEVIDYTLLFVSATGGTQSTTVGLTPFPITVGTDDVTVLFVFIPNTTGGNGGDTYANIDAFDANTGSLVDNDFVQQIIPDQSGSLAIVANEQGYVDTTKSAFQIYADNPIGQAGDSTPQNAPTTAVFLKWLVLSPPGIVNTPVLPAPSDTTIYALAIYQSPKSQKEKEIGKDIKESVKDYKDKDKEFVKETKEKESIKEKEAPKDLSDAKNLHDKTHHIEKGPGNEKTLLSDKQNQEFFKQHQGYEKPTADKPYQGETKSDLGVESGLQGSSYGQQVQALIQKTNALEAKLSNLTKGQAFIKAEDRPSVGKPPKKKK